MGKYAKIYHFLWNIAASLSLSNFRGIAGCRLMIRMETVQLSMKKERLSKLSHQADMGRTSDEVFVGKWQHNFFL
jgi:hypothetical protein